LFFSTEKRTVPEISIQGSVFNPKGGTMLSLTKKDVESYISRMNLWYKFIFVYTGPLKTGNVKSPDSVWMSSWNPKKTGPVWANFAYVIMDPKKELGFEVEISTTENFENADLSSKEFTKFVRLHMEADIKNGTLWRDVYTDALVKRYGQIPQHLREILGKPIVYDGVELDTIDFFYKAVIPQNWACHSHYRAHYSKNDGIVTFPTPKCIEIPRTHRGMLIQNGVSEEVLMVVKEEDLKSSLEVKTFLEGSSYLPPFKNFMEDVVIYVYTKTTVVVWGMINEDENEEDRVKLYIIDRNPQI
jgi:hypothetical protein